MNERLSLMTWNWQQPGWPNFSWDATRLRKAEEHFLVGTGMFAGAVKHLPASDKEQLVIEAISTEAVTTAETQGHRSLALREFWSRLR